MYEVIPNWHPIFVHFTVALLSISLLVFVFSLLTKSESTKKQALTVAHWNFWIAVIITIATVVAGWFAYNSVDHDTPSHAAMTIHKNWAFGSFAVLLVVAAGTYWFKQGIKFFGAGLLAVVILVGITAWHGGELVYRYGLGVMSMPMSIGEGHEHAAVDGHADSVEDKPESHDSHKEAPSHHDDLNIDTHNDSHSHDSPHAH